MENPEEKKTTKKKRRGLAFALVLLTLYLAAVATAVIVYDGRHVRFYMRGAQDMELPLGQAYAEPGCTAVSAGRIFGEGKTPLEVSVSGQVDSGTPGDYELSYSARLLFLEYRTVRRVHVRDLTPPEITLYAVEGYTPDWFSGYQEEG